MLFTPREILEGLVNEWEEGLVNEALGKGGERPELGAGGGLTRPSNTYTSSRTLGMLCECCFIPLY